MFKFKENKCVLMVGSPVKGWTIIGPFESRPEADREAKDHEGAVYICDIYPPAYSGKPSIEKRTRPNIIDEHVDAVIEHVNKVTGRSYRTGKHKNKDLAGKIKARLNEMYSEHNDLSKALLQVKCVADEKMIQSQERSPSTGRPKFSEEWVKPSTLYRASNFFEYLEEARQRARLNGGVVWFRR